MLDFETTDLEFQVSKSSSWRITSFSKTTPLQREPYLTMFYTTNLSPLLITKKGFVLTIILSNYQQCPLPLIKLEVNITDINNHPQQSAGGSKFSPKQTELKTPTVFSLASHPVEIMKLTAKILNFHQKHGLRTLTHTQFMV